MTAIENVPVVPLTDESAVVRFGGGPRPTDRPRRIFEPTAVAFYTPPRDTCDPRYEACTHHHVACDCREAEFAEHRKEMSGEWKRLNEAMDRILAEHPTHTWDDEMQPCQCTGCQIAREIGYYPKRAAVKKPSDEVAFGNDQAPF